MTPARPRRMEPICVKVRAGDPIDRVLKVFKKKQDREGVVKALKARRFYVKPSVKKREKSKAARKTKKVRIRHNAF